MQTWDRDSSRFLNRVGSKLFVCVDTEKLARMTRGRGGYDDSYVPIRRRPVPIDDVDRLYHGSRKAVRVSDIANEDIDDISRSSYNKDRKLLDDITNKLCRLEYDNVKMGREVSTKTGFRRHLYGKSRPPLEKETVEERRLDRLRNPWDYTANNYFRPPKREPRTKSEKEAAKVREKEMDRNRPLWLQSERVAPAKPKDPYPQYDPLGLYRPREKRERQLPPDGCLAAQKYEDMNVREMLCNMKAKVEAMPKRREARLDLDSLLEDVVHKPLPRSHVTEYKTLDGDEFDPDWKYERDPGLDEGTKRKIKDGRSELEQFERMIDNKFGGRRGRRGASAAEAPPLRAPSRVPPKVNLAAGIEDLERELGIGDGGYVEPVPTPLYRMRQPAVVKARTNLRTGYRSRTGSLPPPDRVSRAKLESDIEVDNLALFSDED